MPLGTSENSPCRMLSPAALAFPIHCRRHSHSSKTDPMDGGTSPIADEQQDEGGSEKKEKRTSRACLTCRKRKSACHLPIVDGVVITPCARCKSTGQHCVIGSSNRGGRRVRKKPLNVDAGVDETEDSLPPAKTPRLDISEGLSFAQGSGGPYRSADQNDVFGILPPMKASTG